MRICDTHCDTLFTLSINPDALCDVTLEKLRTGGVSLQTMAMYVGEGGDAETIDRLMKGMLAVWARLKAAGWKQADDPRQCREGESMGMLALEGCEPFAVGLSSIEAWRARGVRMAALTWNHENALAYPAMMDMDKGLKPYGKECVREMQRVGIAVDVSHLSERGFYDVLDMGGRPPLASHSCCAALRAHPRNLTDGQLRALFAAGGYVGVNFYPFFLGRDGRAACDLDRVCEHIEHMFSMGGRGHVGFGSDFDGIECKPDGLADPTDVPALIERLRARGHDERTVESVAGGALLDYYARLD